MEMAWELNGWMNLDEWVMWHIMWESIYDWGTKERILGFSWGYFLQITCT